MVVQDNHSYGGAAMTVSEWVDAAQRIGCVCNDYMRKLNAVTNKSEMFRVLCDVNGGSWLFELHAKGISLPIEPFLSEFKNYVNGKKVVNYQDGYSSKFYCRHAGTIVADTTLVYLLECEGADVIVPKNRYPTLILSDGSQADITLEDGARMNVDLYGNARCNLEGDKANVRIIRH